MRKPDHPNYNRRAAHHDYNRPAKYLITTLKNPEIPPFAKIEGDPDIKDGPNAPHTVITRTGDFILQALQIWSEKFSQLEISDYVIMPDHIHLCLDVIDYLPNGLSLAISGLKGKISSLRYEALPQRYREKGFMPIFEKGFNDRIAYTSQNGQNKKVKIIRLNADLKLTMVRFRFLRLFTLKRRTLGIMQLIMERAISEYVRMALQKGNRLPVLNLI